MSECPFNVGDTVIFTNRSAKAGFPGHHGLPNIGDAVTITKIVNDKYVYWKGGEQFLGGGLHWTEFQAAPRVA